MPLQATSGAASQDAFGGNGVPIVPTYIEEVFSTWLATGAGTSFTINNGIDLSTKGGMAWMKRRSSAQDNYVFDTIRGAGKALVTNDTIAEYNNSQIDSFTTTGFTGSFLANASTNVFWTFRKQPKFFDVVTYTGTGVAGTVAHNLGSVPGCIIVKRTDNVATWQVYHVATGNGYSTPLNETSRAGATNFWNNTSPTSTEFSVNTQGPINAAGGTYVAYLFAHNAGGFGLTGTDNVISCGSYVGNGLTAGPQVTLGYEPQWVLRKNVSNPQGGPGTAGSWSLVDNMRGLSQTTCPFLFANESAAENTSTVTTGYIIPNATGFVDTYTYPGDTYIYIAIRRGPMKVPTTGTSVFKPAIRTGTGASATVTGIGFSPDLVTSQDRGSTGFNNHWQDRLRGPSGTAPLATDLSPQSSSAESSQNQALITIDMDGVTLGTGNQWNYSGEPFVNYFFKRAPSFFDEICFNEATAPVSALPHNLTVVPELVIYKKRSSTSSWITFSNVDFNKYLRLNTDNALTAGVGWSATSTTVDLSQVTGSATAVAYLFATAAGVSKVGSYTGNGSTQTINCGFGAGGARFVLIKRTDSTGDWYVYDTARGMTVLTDPYLWLNSTNAEVATLGSVTTVSTGFAVNAAIVAAINTNAASYIFLAIS